jgi:predicted DNA-binding transcriptional regulator YafY
MDWQVVKFLTGLQYAQAAKTFSREDKLQMIETAIIEKKSIEILYLKGQDEKTRRIVSPLFMGEMEYKGHPYLGLAAFCQARKEKRIFNVDKILEITEPGPGVE